MRNIVMHSSPTINKWELETLSKIVKSLFLSRGEYCSKYENKLKEISGQKYAISVNSGTTALFLALKALKISTNDRVGVPSYSCTALLNAVNYCKAKPVILDVEEKGFNLSSGSLSGVKNLKAIIVPHLLGFPANIDKIKKVIGNVPIIEDCAMTFGMTYKNKRIGSWGKISILSTYSTKLLTTGLGGAIMTSDKKLFDTISDMIDYDNRDDYKVRYNVYISDLNAGLGFEQLKRLKEFVNRRREIARLYNKSFRTLPVVLPGKLQDGIFYRYPLILENENSDKMIKYMKSKGIEAKRPVYKPLHRYLNLSKKKYPNTEYIHSHIISIPIYPKLAKKDINYIIKTVIGYFRQN